MVQFPGTGPVELATILQRVVARCIDAAGFVVVAALAFGALYRQLQVDLTTAAYNPFAHGAGFFSVRLDLYFLLGLPAVLAVIVVVYEWLLIGLCGATLGKMAMHLRVVDQRTGRYIGMGRALVRHIIILGPSFLPYLGVFLSLAVLLSPLFDKSGRRQGWHDKVAKDLVIKL